MTVIEVGDWIFSKYSSPRVKTHLVVGIERGDPMVRTVPMTATGEIIPQYITKCGRMFWVGSGTVRSSFENRRCKRCSV